MVLKTFKDCIAPITEVINQCNGVFSPRPHIASAPTHAFQDLTFRTMTMCECVVLRCVCLI